LVGSATWPFVDWIDGDIARIRVLVSREEGRRRRRLDLRSGDQLVLHPSGTAAAQERSERCESVCAREGVAGESPLVAVPGAERPFLIADAGVAADAGADQLAGGRGCWSTRVS